MFYQYNNLTGRLSVSTNIQTPLFPIAPKPLSKVEPPKLVYDKHMKMSSVSSVRAQAATKLIPGTNTKYGAITDAFRQRQELFQKPNGIPVFLKGGPADRIMYLATFAIIGVGFITFGRLIYSLAFANRRKR